MKRRNFISVAGLLPFIAIKGSPVNAYSNLLAHADIRKYWVDMAYKIAFPILDALSKDELKMKMPVEACTGQEADRRKFTLLEAFARLMSGLSPWLKLEDNKLDPEELKMRNSLLEMYYSGIIHAVDPGSSDHLNFSEGYQPLVDAAFLSHAFIKAPKLFEALDNNTKQNIIHSFIETRKFKPFMNNWLLFSAVREAFFIQAGQEYEKETIEFALTKHMEWYKGDGVFGDGPSFHWDYYNSYVIHPLMLDLLKILNGKLMASNEVFQSELTRAQRYSEILERLISPEGTFPAVGRSLAYRAGAFQLLAQLALNHQLPVSLSPGQVRSALTAVIQKTMDAPGTFNKAGWLQIGLHGHQPGIGETYISTGSLYLCTTAFLPLGLPRTDPFWSEPACDWTSRKLWSGLDIPADHAITN